MRNLLSDDDPAPVDLVRADSSGTVGLVCEHAGQAVPQSLGNLGLSAGEIDLHIGWDIGAEGVARGLSELLNAPLVIQRYSRLVIDCNRPLGAHSSIPEESDRIRILGNLNLSADQRRQREVEIFAPYAKAALSLSEKPGLQALFSIHSYTPNLSGAPRPWDIGFLYRATTSGGERLASLCKALWPELCVGRNEPYRIESDSDWFIPVCAEPTGLAHCLIEIRNDHIASAAGQADWAARLAKLITVFLETSK